MKDRDNFITVRYENIQTGLEYAFEKYDSSKATTLGFQYELELNLFLKFKLFLMFFLVIIQ